MAKIWLEKGLFWDLNYCDNLICDLQNTFLYIYAPQP